MIRVERKPCPPTLDPADATAAGAKELKEILDKLDGVNDPDERKRILKSVDYTAYGHITVRDALRDMFHGKCAYCESKIAGDQDTDIEHYRPKKRISEAQDAGVDHEGYWWLAMDWNNLVLSCKHCNQRRKSQVIIPDHIETLEELEAFLIDPPRSASGKLDSFPTLDNHWISGPDQELAGEKPLLINPVDTDPEMHLEWVLTGSASLVRAMTGSQVGETTRQVLGLNRRWLEEERRIGLMEMQIDRDEIIEGINGWLEADTDELAVLHRNNADRGIKRLLRRTEAHRPFSGLAKAFLSTVQEEVAQMENPVAD